MKITTLSTLRSVLCGIALIIGMQLSTMSAAVTYEGINYTTSGTKATVAKYATGTLYKGVINIPETFTVGGITYTVVATAANAFKDCIEVTQVTLPKTCVTIGRNTFIGCTALTNYPIPEEATSIGNGVCSGCTSLTEAFIPAGVTSPVISDQFAGCTSLKKFTIKSSSTPIDFAAAAFGATPASPLEEVYIGRDLTTKYPFPFKNMATIKTLTLADALTTLPSEAFANCTALSSVTFGTGVNLTTIPTSTFKNDKSLTSIALPAAVTAINGSAFYGCTNLATVTGLDNVTAIGSYAFYHDGAITSITLPAGLNSIGAHAFDNTGLSGTVTLPASLTSLGDYAYANNAQISGFAIGASVASIGTGAFALCPQLANITVDAANAAYKADKGVLSTTDGKTIIVVAPQSTDVLGQAEFSNATATEVGEYAFWATPYKTITLPALATIGNYAFMNTPNLESFTIGKTMNVGLYAFKNSGLKSLTFEEGYRQVVQGTAMGAASLASVTLPSTITSISKDAFAGCSSLQTMNLGKNVNYLEGGAVPTTLSTLRCENQNVPAIAPDLFTDTAACAKITCKVAATAVADYKAAAGWNLLSITADATITGMKAQLGCPTGLYFATKDGKLEYLSADNKIVDTEIASGTHAFQLGSYNNRVYVAYAGTKFTYQDPAATQGDGETFYINKSGDTFYRVTVLNNFGCNAFEDPFSMTILPTEQKILLADRNVGLHMISTEAVGLFGSQDFFLQNNQLAYYNNGITYGAIGCGIFKDKNETFWMGKKFNGNGIFRFKKEDIGNTGNPTQPILFNGYTITTFYMDEANGYMYLYVQSSSSADPATPGIWRVSLADIEAHQADTKLTTYGTLIDDSPVLLEGSAPAELTGVTQITGNGAKIYWAYIAPENATDLYIGSKPLDTANPLHKSGIKQIAATGSDLTVTYAVPDVKAYGVIATINPNSGVSNVATDKGAARSTVKGYNVTVPANAIVKIFAVNGTMLSSSQVNGGATVSLEGLAKGMYLVQVIYSNGTKETVKVVR